jgi:hypothetical protein
MVLVVPRDDHAVCGSLVNGNTFYHIFWALFALGFSIYPCLILGLLVLPPVLRAFAHRSAEGHGEGEEDRRGRRRRGVAEGEEDQSHCAHDREDGDDRRRR